MSQTVWIPDEYASQFGLLGAMARELLEAMRLAGHDARPISVAQLKELDSGILFFMNSPASIDMLPDALFTPQPTMRAVQFMVDHPFALPDTIIDEWRRRTGLTNYRLCMPCADDAHLLRARFPGLVHRWVPHGVPSSALCDPGTLTPEALQGRKYDVVVTGSIRTEQEIQQLTARLSTQLATMAREMAELMITRPHMGYMAAADLVMGTRGIITGDWDTARGLWALVIAMVNRVRRISTLRALQGLRVGVFGPPAWEPECTGTISYGGELGYERCAEAFGQGRVALAWGPSQFVHSYSERIMQAMAAGACVACDDRLLVERDFGDACVRFDWSQAEHARACVDKLLGDPDRMLELARTGRETVERRCLWTHRVEELVGAAKTELVAGG